MRVSRSVCLVLASLTVSGAARAGDVAATFLCGSFKGGKVHHVVPSPDGRKESDIIQCALKVTANPGDKPLKAAFFARDPAGKEMGARIVKSLAKAEAEVRLEPGKAGDSRTHFVPCQDFTIHAELVSAKVVVWSQQLEVKQSCGASASPATGKAAGPQAAFGCKQILKDGSASALSAEGAARITGKEIQCEIVSKDVDQMQGRATVQTTWHRSESGALKALTGKERNGSMVGSSDEGELGYMFVLERGTDWDECAADLTVPVKVFTPEGKLRFERRLVFKQDCPAGSTATAARANAKPGGAKDPNAEVVFADGELEKIADPAGQSTAQSWAQIFLDEDAAAFVKRFPKAGVTVGKKTLKPATLSAAMDKAGGMRKLVGVVPMFGCADPKADANCRWDKWRVLKKSASEYWLYNTDDSFYGPYRSLVFQKKGTGWMWTAVADLDMGEP